MRYVIVAGFLTIAVAAAMPPASAQESFADFIVGLRNVCAEQPSRTCTRRVSSFLDGDNDNQVSLREFEALRAAAKSTVSNRDSGLSAIERNLISISLLTLRQAKLATVFANFDTDKSGGLSEGELFADFRLDSRPFAKIVSDPNAVDWQEFAARFGKVGFLVFDLLPPGHRK